MQAFICHSSANKPYASAVFEYLGRGLSIYDASSFKAGSTSQSQMVSLIERCGLFVLLWSAYARDSPGVEFELQVLRGEVAKRGLEVLIVSIDAETPETLPVWLRHHVVEQVEAPGLAARRIEAKLLEVRSLSAPPPIFVNRSQELAELQSILSAPTDDMPVAIAVCGWTGVGRRALSTNALQSVIPGTTARLPTLSLTTTEGPLEFLHKVVDLAGPRSVSEWASITQQFEAATAAERTRYVLDAVSRVAQGGDPVVVIDEGGIIADDNQYQTWFSDLVHAIPRRPQPTFILIQNRKTTIRNQEAHPTVSFVQVGSLDDLHAQTLLGSHLKRLGLRYTREQVEEVCHFVGGHPADLVQAAKHAKRRGVADLVRNRADFRQATMKHSIDLLSRMELTASDLLVVSVLRDYRFLAINDLLDGLSAAAKKASDASMLKQPDRAWIDTLEVLEGYAIIERWSSYFRVAPFLTDAISRYVSSRSDVEQRNLRSARESFGEAMLGLVDAKSTESGLSLGTVESAMLASLRHSDKSMWFQQMALPSHLLHLARECYDDRNYERAERLVREANKRRNLMTTDARAEAHRLLAMCLIRLGRHGDADEPIKSLAAIGSNIAKRNHYFIRGFRARVQGDFDSAEEHYRVSLSFGRKNFHTLRELAYLLLVQRRFSEAERFARSAKGIAPSNPFVLDILCAVLIRKPRSQQSTASDPELLELLNSLEIQDERQGTSFYDARLSDYYAATGQPDRAMELASSAAKRRGGPLLDLQFAVGARAIEAGAFEVAREALGQAQRLLADPHTHDRSRWPVLLELQTMFCIASGDLGGAVRILRDNDRRVPARLRMQLAVQIAERARDVQGNALSMTDQRWLDELRTDTRRSSVVHSRGAMPAAGSNQMSAEARSLKVGQAVQGSVVNRNPRVGTFVSVLGFTALVPSSKENLEVRNTRPGDSLSLKVVSIEPERPSLILQPLSTVDPDEVLSSLQRGDHVRGTVIDLNIRVGIFIDVNGFKGLMPMSYASNELINALPGDHVDCRVRRADRHARRLILEPAG